MVGRVIAAWPSFALTASYELLTHQVWRGAAGMGIHDIHGRSHEPCPRDRRDSWLPGPIRLITGPPGVWLGEDMHLPAAVSTAIVGRDREQAELAAALTGARTGHGRATLLLGEAGMGKSVLADWLVGQAEQAGVQVARAACSAAGMPPLWPWRRSLAAIGLELPWLEDHAVAGPADRELMAAAIVEAVAAVAARQPLLIVLEDLHWSDPVSVLVARAVAEAAAALPPMLLLTCRDERDEATQRVRDRLAELPASVRRMLLPPLDAAAVAALAGSIAGSGLAGQALAGLQTRTGGNPFFVHEVARLMAARGSAAALTLPPGVREVLQRRLARLSQPCMSLLTAAAIVAETAAEMIEDDLLCRVSGISEADVARLLDEAAAGRLLEVDRAGPVRYRFRHALVREVLEHGLSGAQRGMLHAAAAEALEQRASQPAPVARLAYHWSRAAGPEAHERAVAWSLRAARDAVAGFGFEAATAHYARALAGLPTGAIEVSVEYGEALQLCGDVAAAREVLLGAAREAAAAGRASDLARAALALGGGLAGSRSRCTTRSRQICCVRPTRHCLQMRPRCGPRCAAGCLWCWPARYRRRTGWRWPRTQSGWPVLAATGRSRRRCWPRTATRSRVPTTCASGPRPPPGCCAWQATSLR